MKRRLTFDFETRSACDLKGCGAFKYSSDPTTRATCLAFKIHGEPTIYFLDFEMVGLRWGDLPEKFRNLWTRLIKEGYEFSGHNVFFDMAVYKNVLVARQEWPDIPFLRFRCTAAKAAACALPRNLEGAGSALALSVQKDKRGYVAMMATCKPTKAWTAWAKRGEGAAPKMFLEPDDSAEAAEIFKTLYTYCKYDVLTEEALDDRLPDLNPIEQEVWHLNQEINWRGVQVDIPTVKKIISIMETESSKKLKELDSLTMGLVTKPGARKSILEFLALDGVELPDIKAQTVDDALKGGKLNPDMKRLLELRKALSKSSTKKYQAFEKRASDDGRVRDLILYHGASTGRDSGTGIQIQNLAKRLIPQKEVEYVLEMLKGPVDESVVEWLGFFYGDPSIVFSSLLRSMIQASPGHELFAADFSKIEVAVCWWAAGNAPGLAVLNSGRDPYKYQAAANTGKTYEEIGDEGDERQLAKAQILGCQFGMGWKKFQSTAWDQYRLKLTDEQSKLAVKNYREANAAVPELWKDYELAAITAVENPGETFEAGKCNFIVSDGFLWVTLPSRRRLAYANPQISWRMREFEVEDKVENADGTVTVTTRTEVRGPYKTLEFYAVNSKTKKWGLERTWGGTLTENCIQAIARDLMMSALVRLEKAGYRALFAVHDEGVCERKIGEGSVEEFVKIMCLKPRWAAGLPVDAKGWSSRRYRK